MNRPAGAPTDSDDSRQSTLGFALLDVIADCVWFKDVHGRYTAANAAFAALLGRPKSEIIGARTDELFPESAAERYRRRDDLAIERGESVTIEEQVEDATGRMRWLETVATPVRDEHGTLLGTSGVARDITERKSAEAARHATDSRFRAIFDESPFGIGIADRNGRMLDANATYLRMVGYSLDELRQVRFGDLSPGDLSENLALFDDLVAGRRDVYTIEKVYRSKAGESRFARVTTAAVRDEDGAFSYSVGMVEDVTDRKNAEAELRAREEEFRQAQKMESVGRLAGGVAHDFNNLLTVIIAHAEFLRRGDRDSQAWRDDIDQIADAAFHASGLTRQLLAFGRKQILHPRAIDINEVVENIVPLLRRSLGEDVRLELALDRSLPRVNADPGQLDQVIVNLVSNAREAMPRGGVLTLATHAADPAGAHVHGPANERPTAPLVALSVRDTGVGIAPEIEPRIFEPFFTTKDVGHGTGLGLSTVYGIIRQSGGSVAVESRVGEGTTVTIALPLADADEMRADAPNGAAAPRRAHNTVLLVEDEAAVRQLAKRILTASGYDVVDAPSGSVALDWLEKHPEPIALLLTDVVMPGMSGRDLAAAATRLQPSLRVVYTSGYAGDDVFERGLLPHGTAFVPKPFSASTLVAAVRQRLEN